MIILKIDKVQRCAMSLGGMLQFLVLNNAMYVLLQLCPFFSINNCMYILTLYFYSLWDFQFVKKCHDSSSFMQINSCLFNLITYSRPLSSLPSSDANMLTTHSFHRSNQISAFDQNTFACLHIHSFSCYGAG